MEKKRMVKQFEEGKIYALKGCRKPYEEIVECVHYDKEHSPLMDTYTFDKYEPLTQGRIYETNGNLEGVVNFSPENYEEIGTSHKNYEVGDTTLTIIKPKYTDLEAALKEIVEAKNSDFRNWHQMADKLKDVARKALGLE